MTDYRNCPFCKKEIPKDSIKCPLCTVVLIEKIITVPPQYQGGFEKETKNTTRHNCHAEKNNPFDNIADRIKSLDVIGNWKIILIIIAVPVFIVGIYRKEKNEQVSTPPVINSKYISKKSVTNPLEDTVKNYYSLPNGTIIYSQPYYLDGLGELKIDNGRNVDAVAKLINIGINKSIYTVYIRAKEIFRIKGISDGIYKLYFVSGNDWERLSGKFLVNKSYSKFKDNFEFITTEKIFSDEIQTRYSVFEITLHPVIAGTAKTDKISEKEFENY